MKKIKIFKLEITPIQVIGVCIFGGAIFLSTLILLVVTNSKQIRSNLINNEVNSYPLSFTAEDIPTKPNISGNELSIDNTSIGIGLGKNINYSLIKTVTSCSDSVQKYGFIEVKLDNENIPSMLIANKDILDHHDFTEYYRQFNQRTLKNDSFILYPYCGGARYDVITNNFHIPNILKFGYVTSALGGYQYIPSDNEYVSINITYFQFDERNLIQVQIILKPFKFNEVNGFETCYLRDTKPVSYNSYADYSYNSIDQKCFADLLTYDGNKQDIIESKIKDIIDSLDIQKNY